MILEIMRKVGLLGAYKVSGIINSIPPLIGELNKLDGFPRFRRQMLDDGDSLYIVLRMEGENNDAAKNRLTDRVQRCLDQIYGDLQNTMRIEGKLEIIAKGIAELERIHPFKDANCRTFCMVMLNSLLMQHDFPPAIMENPNQFDGCSTQELVKKIKEGMEATDTLCGIVDGQKVEAGEKFQIATQDQSELTSYASALSVALLSALVSAPIKTTSKHDGVIALQLILARFGETDRSVVPRVFSSSLRLAAEAGDLELLNYLLNGNNIKHLSKESVADVFKVLSEQHSPDLKVIKKILVLLPDELRPKDQISAAFVSQACMGSSNLLDVLLAEGQLPKETLSVGMRALSGVSYPRRYKVIPSSAKLSEEDRRDTFSGRLLVFQKSSQWSGELNKELWLVHGASGSYTTTAEIWEMRNQKLDSSTNKIVNYTSEKEVLCVLHELAIKTRCGAIVKCCV